MKKLAFIGIVFTLCSTMCISQGENHSVNPVNYEGQSLLKKTIKKNVKQEYFLFDTWRQIDMYLTGNQKAITHPGKIDLYNKGIDLNVANTIQTLSVTRLDSFSVITISEHGMVENGIFFNSKVFDQDTEDSFLELIEEGSTRLLKKYKVKYKKANYNVALSTGNRDGKFLLSEEYYFLTSEDELIEIPSNKKSFYKMLSTFSGAASFAKSEKLKRDKVEDLILLTNYINKIK